MHYFYSDQLGSSSVIAKDGVTVQVEEDLDYFPYGGTAYGTPSDHYEFTGKERDSESGLDNFTARYYSSALGRFMIPDWSDRPAAVPYAYIGNPQTLNLYSYVQNDPLSFIDPDGHCWRIIQWWQHACNAADGLGWRSDAQVEQALHDAHLFLRINGVTAEQQEKLSDKQVLALTKAVENHQNSVISDGAKITLQVVTIVAGALPGANPQWGKNRFIKELHDRGFVYDGPTNSGDGLMYKNPTTGAEVRVMPNPGRTPYRGEPAAKFENDNYYRYRSGPDQPWGPHNTLPDK